MGFYIAKLRIQQNIMSFFVENKDDSFLQHLCAHEYRILNKSAAVPK